MYSAHLYIYNTYTTDPIYPPIKAT